MNKKKKAGKFLFIPSHALVVVVSVVAVINIASAEFVNNSISNTGKLVTVTLIVLLI